MKPEQEYQLEDLLQDENFLRWQRKATPELEEFWKERVTASPGLAQKIRLAKLVVSRLKANEAVLMPLEMEEMWQHIDVEMKHRIRKKKVLAYVSVAASLILILTTSWFLLSRNTWEESSGIQFVKRPEGKITDVQLIFAQDKVKKISGKEIEICYDDRGQVKVNSETIETRLPEECETTQDQENLVYNQLIVPVGKRSSLLLADGSKIWVNAGSRVVYPVRFTQNKREIFVEGEVFLEVARNEKQPFYVKTHRFEVKVLGTSFNISAYEDEEHPSVVLVTGKVHVRTNERQEMNLTPNDMFVYSGEKSYLRLVDVYDYIAWKDGLYRFESTCLTTILERISRYYGKKIVIEPEISGMTCSGKLNLKEDLQDLMEGLIKSVPVYYRLSNDTIYVTPK